MHANGMDKTGHVFQRVQEYENIVGKLCGV